jgi:toxin FitB
LKYLLDTNVVSEFRKGSRRNEHVNTWLKTVVGDDLFVSVLALGELRKGLEQIRGRDKVQAAALAEWIDGLHKIFSSRVVGIDMAIAEEWGRMCAIRPLPAVDSLMAATAKVQGMTFVTRDMFDTRNLGVRVLNPFEPR